MIKTEKIHVGEFCDFKLYDSVRNHIIDVSIPKLKSIGIIYGEFGREPGMIDTSLINVSHGITDIEVNGYWITITYKILDVRNGKELKALIESGIPTRIAPTVFYNTNNTVELIAFDIDPGVNNQYREKQLKDLLGE